ncbi:hypothetical protein GcM1_247179 [Golovinomyces cichoracearum]|uniref:Uncharacterized protein n=1 Tax=Golovinomyces cichoracearum TaxID=62708 RepID=A0A420IDV5_9PEZI|nr:hypothetical protein GcM1_247179 [Golovinomyces cichoracearum]
MHFFDRCYSKVVIDKRSAVIAYYGRRFGLLLATKGVIRQHIDFDTMENVAQLAVEPGRESLKYLTKLLIYNKIGWITGNTNSKAANANQSPGHALETLIDLNELNDKIQGWIKLEANDNSNEQQKII